MVTRKSSDDYNTLFGLASDFLNLEGENRISALDQYFSHIEELAAAADSHPEFMRLPIDEPSFEIDLDTREIIIPSEFANGISVEGDQIAENIWFKVDRFFDQKDLLPTDGNTNYHIIVQWTNADNVEGLSETLWYNYKINNNNTLIFCWPITEAITAKAGTVKFSVRFYETKADNISTVIYNLNTQPCSVEILEALDSSKNVNDIRSYTLDRDAENYIVSQLKNTANVGPYSADTPVFLEPTVPTASPWKSEGINLTEDADGEKAIFLYDATQKRYVIEDLTEHTSAIDFYVAIDEGVITDENDFNYFKTTLPTDNNKLYVYNNRDGFNEIASFPNEEDDDAEVPIFYVKKSSKNYVDLYIEAMSSDNGEISYLWENSSSVRDVNHEENAIYLKTNDSAPVSGTIYYQKVNNTYQVWNSLSSTEFPDDTTIYERYSHMKASIADTYYGMAKNHSGNSTCSTGHTRAKEFIVVGPTAPTLTVSDAARNVVITYHLDEDLSETDGSASNTQQPGYLAAKDFIEKTDKEVSDYIYYFDSDSQEWKELASLDDWDPLKQYYRKYAKLNITATADNAKEVLSYQWALNKAVDGYGNTRRHVPVEEDDAKAASLETIVPNSLTDADERYVVDVTSSRNNAEVTVSSELYRVTNLPVAPTLTGDYYVLDGNGIPKWQRDEMGNKVVTEQYRTSQPNNEDFADHGASSYINVAGITSDVMKFKVTPSVPDGHIADGYYYEWHVKTDTTDRTIKEGSADSDAVCYFPKVSSDNSQMTSSQIIGTNIYCNVWTKLNGLGRPADTDYDFPACGKDSTTDKVYANLYGNMVTSARFVIYKS